MAPENDDAGAATAAAVDEDNEDGDNGPREKKRRRRGGPMRPFTAAEESRFAVAVVEMKKDLRQVANSMQRHGVPSGP